jgi:hypothetical protein
LEHFSSGCQLSLPQTLLPLLSGGYAVLKAVQKGMSLPAHKLLPSFAALREVSGQQAAFRMFEGLLGRDTPA